MTHHVCMLLGILANVACLIDLYFSGFVQTVSVIGPIFGYLLGALCAKIYVDFGYVDMGE